MKKILLLLVSGLFIACMAGSAMATSTELIPNDAVTVLPNSNADVILNVNSFPAGSYDLSLTVSSPDFKAYIWDDSTGILNLAEAIYGTPAHNTINLPANQDLHAKIRIIRGANTGVGTVTVSLNGQGDVITVVSSETIGVNVPEFPTVAAPIAAVLGLLFVFGRKKEGL